MKHKERILRIILKFFWHFAKKVKQKPKRITFVTLESDKLENDFLMLANELKQRGEYELKYHLVKFEKTIIGNMKYLIACIYQLFLINSSKVVLLDFNNYVASNFKNEDVKIIQVWHASGAIKKFGNMIPRDYVIKNYDYVICNAEVFKPIFSQGFSVEEKNVINTGIPRTDILFDIGKMEEKRKEFFEQYPNMIGKKIILYAPTFRGRLMDGLKDVCLDMNELITKLPDDYAIIYKMHPLISECKKYESDKIICANQEDLYKLFAVSDCLISDYSAVIFDYSILGKPMYFYAPDYEEYKKNPGFCIDYVVEMPTEICYNLEDVVRRIINQEYNEKSLNEFRMKYFNHDDGKSCERVASLIEYVINNEV